MSEPNERERLRAEVERLRQSFDDLVYAVSHDLRQPLVGIRGFSDLLAEDLAGRVGAEQMDFIRHISKNTDKLDRTLAALLQLSRRARNVDLSQRTTLGPLLDDVVSRCGALAKQRRGTLAVAPDLPESLPGDAEDLSYLFGALVENALVFSVEMRPARVEIGSGPPHAAAPELHHLWVRDNGSGIPADRYEDAFRPLSKLTPDTPNRAGVGLAVCKKIVERHGGNIWLESVVDKGTTVHFTWPR